MNLSILRGLSSAVLGLLFACDGTSEEPAVATEAIGVAASEGCSARMVQLPMGTCMDRHEAQVEDGRAVSAEGQLPSNGLSFNDAASACDAAGFRLCTRDEWNAACGGDGRNDYPYGADYEQDRCNSAPNGTDVSSRALAASGSFARCVSPLGVHDLSGNLVEWIDSADETGTLRELRGGSFATYPAKSVCEFEHHVFQPPEAAYDGQGFRCCSDG